MVNISQLANNLKQDSGIWVSKTREKILYPTEANQVYQEIEETSFWFKHRNRFILEALKIFASEPKQFADVGGGNGFTACEIQKNGYETILVEPGEEGVVVAKRRGVVHLINSSLQAAEFHGGVFQNVGLFDVVEHIQDDVAFLHEINRILKDNGVVFVTVPAFEGLWSQNDDNAQHCRRYTLNTFSKMAEKAGFRTVYSTYFFTLLPIAIFILRSLPYRLGIKYSSIYKKAAKEHKAGMVASIMNRIGAFEINAIRNGRRMPLGSSCLIVLKKKGNE